METFLIFIRSLIRTAVDCCILPGTMNGTEILWLYILQWKKEVSAISFAVISILSQISAPSDIGVITHHAVNKSERTQ